MKQEFVDASCNGVLGIYGGYAANAAMTERRFKAVATVVGANFGRIMREGDQSPDAAIKALEGICAQRTAETKGSDGRGLHPLSSQRERESAGVHDVDMAEAIDYYMIQRDQKPGSPNKLSLTSTIAVYGWDALHLADKLLTQPLQIIVGGGQAGAFGSYRDGFELFNKARSEKKSILVVPAATHYDLYDQPGPVKQAVEKLKEFYGESL